MQNVFMRLVYIWSLEERRNRADLVEVYKMINGQSAIPATNFFEFNTDRRTRGHQFKLKKRQSAKDIRLHFFSERVTNRWNGLPSDIVSAKSTYSKQDFNKCETLRSTSSRTSSPTSRQITLLQTGSGRTR